MYLVNPLRLLFISVRKPVIDAVDYQPRQILEDKFCRFQTRLEIANDDMDDASRRNLESLKREAELPHAGPPC